MSFFLVYLPAAFVSCIGEAVYELASKTKARRGGDNDKFRFVRREYKWRKRAMLNRCATRLSV